jgi:uncharacterized membrane protein YphA (DoxX/SURF4 family)
MGVAVFVIRLLLGGLLVTAGALKAHDGPAATASTIAGYRILPAVVVSPLGFLLPYGEIFLGAYLVLGLLTRAVASVATVQFLVFAGAVASLVVRQIPADCGCFGSGVSMPPSWGHVGADVALAGLAALVAWRAPGAWAADRILGLGGSLTAQRESPPL